MGGLFESQDKKLPGPKMLETPWGPEMREYLTNLMKTSQPQQFADMTANEQQGQDLLGGYLSSGAPEAYNLGMDQLRNTLTGGYDPNTSQMYAGLRSQMQDEEAQNIANLRRRQQLGGVSSFGPSYRAEGELMNTASNQRNSLLGSLYEQERQKQQAATNQALQYSQYGDQSQLAKLAAAQQYGSLPRDIQNQRYAADTANQQYQSQLAQMLLQYQPWYQPQYSSQPSVFSQVLTGIGGLIPFASGGGGNSSPTISQGTTPGGGGGNSLSSQLANSSYANYQPQWSWNGAQGAGNSMPKWLGKNYAGYGV